MPANSRSRSASPESRSAEGAMAQPNSGPANANARALADEAAPDERAGERLLARRHVDEDRARRVGECTIEQGDRRPLARGDDRTELLGAAAGAHHGEAARVGGEPRPRRRAREEG